MMTGLAIRRTYRYGFYKSTLQYKGMSQCGIDVQFNRIEYIFIPLEL